MSNKHERQAKVRREFCGRQWENKGHSHDGPHACGLEDHVGVHECGGRDCNDVFDPTANCACGTPMECMHHPAGFENDVEGH